MSRVPVKRPRLAGEVWRDNVSADSRIAVLALLSNARAKAASRAYDGDGRALADEFAYRVAAQILRTAALPDPVTRPPASARGRGKGKR